MSEDRTPLYTRWPVVFLAGPVVWYLFFWIAYLIAEAGCAPGVEPFEIFGWSGVSFLTVALTAAAVGLIAWFFVVAYRQTKSTSLMDVSEDPDDFRSTFLALGTGLAVLFIAASLFVGLPALVLAPC